MQWSDVDEAKEWWTIPGTQTKNGVPHRVPLTKAALALIAEAGADGSGLSWWVFWDPQGGTLKDQSEEGCVESSTRGASDGRLAAPIACCHRGFGGTHRGGAY